MEGCVFISKTYTDVAKKNTKPSMNSVHLFAQIASLIPRDIVEKAAKKHNSNYKAKKFDTWHHLITMMFCHLGSCKSLREITQCLESATGNLQHLGMQCAPSRNALSYMNATRSWEVYRDIYLNLFDTLGQHLGRKHIFSHLKNKVYLLDSSYVTLCASVFDWAHYTHEKGAIKMHTLFDFEGLLPRYIYVSDGKLSDNLGAYYTFPAKGSIIVCDRGYVDSELWADWDSNGVAFVVRLRDDVKYRRLAEFDQPDDKEQNILIDEAVELIGDETAIKYPHPLRRVSVWDNQHSRRIDLITNMGKHSAQDIADLYKARWYIESFFKTIKQLLRIKTFVGTSKNAVLTQIWTAMIALLVLFVIRNKSTRKWSFSNLISFLRLNIFVKIDLWEWVNEQTVRNRAHEPNTQLMLF